MITKFNLKDRTVKSYAIRKLTPRECFRLMGVRDGVIDQMQCTAAEARRRVGDKTFLPKAKDGAMAVAASQQYRQAGNSIVVDVLAALYEQLWYPEPRKPEAQLSLFDELFPEDALPPLPREGERGDDGEKVILTTFSGYDSQLMAADALRERRPEFQWTCAGWSDIDKFACQMHDIVFPRFKDKALGDITKIDWQRVKASLGGREVDLFTYSSPCQDISQAGKQMGLREGSDTRSALLWRVADAVEALRPKYLLQENVAALVSEKFMPDFKLWLAKLESLGYVNRWARLNAKDYGVPQNRDRVFCLSMRRDVAFDYQFPAPAPLERKLADVLELDVDERYFLRDKAVGEFLEAYNKDAAVFVQFDIAPTHEAAMFLKTWLTRFMAADSDRWTLAPNDLKEAVDGAKESFMADYALWRANGILAMGDAFAAEFKDNLERK